MLRSLFVHYRNKYPKARVMHSDQGLDVISSDNELLLALRKNGAGQVIDAQALMGARDAHDLSPLPKDARAYKLFKDGHIGQAEEYSSRVAFAAEIAVKDRVPSCEELSAAGWEFDDKQRVVKRAKPE